MAYSPTIACPLDNCGADLTLNIFEDRSVGIWPYLEEFSGECPHVAELNALLEAHDDDEQFRAHPRVAPVYAVVDEQNRLEAEGEAEMARQMEEAEKEWERVQAERSVEEE